MIDPTGTPYDDSGPHSQEPPHSARNSFDRTLVSLRRRLVQEATFAVGMLEGALEALWNLDRAAADEVRRRDDRVDLEEVAIEEECYRILTLQAPVARDLRVITFILKVNADIERVADHAASIAKLVKHFEGTVPRWPTALLEIGQRVPMMCHALLRAVLDEDVEAAKQVKAEDKTIDALDRRLFEETVESLRKGLTTAANSLLIYRIGRELERIGDLMTNIAEDLVYLATGQIIRHAKKRARLNGSGGAQPGGEAPGDLAG